jgi:hypothetical protein
MYFNQYLIKIQTLFHLLSYADIESFRIGSFKHLHLDCNKYNKLKPDNKLFIRQVSGKYQI